MVLVERAVVGYRDGLLIVRREGALEHRFELLFLCDERSHKETQGALLHVLSYVDVRFCNLILLKVLQADATSEPALVVPHSHCNGEEREPVQRVLYLVIEPVKERDLSIR